MKTRSNLRIQSSIIKQKKCQIFKDNSLIDDYDQLLARHHRHRLEEQKDRKLYERYVRGQRTLRRLQCRRTHTAHLNQATRTRLLRELERERRYTIQDHICNYLSDHTILFRHGYQINSKQQTMTWSSLENELKHQKHFDTIHQLDVMINNLKKVIQTSKDSISKPRLSVHERRKQRLTTTTIPVLSNNHFHLFQSSTISSINSTIIPLSIVDDSSSTTNNNNNNNSHHLTCIQNVLKQNNTRLTSNEFFHLSTSRKQYLRSKSMSSYDSSQNTRKRPIEKENCSLMTSTNVVLRANSPMISIKSSSSPSTFRSYPNTRKHPLTTRRHTRLS